MEPAAIDTIPEIIDLMELDIPSMPAVAIKMIEMSNDDGTDAEDLARVIETDPALSTRLLQLANSAAHGLRSEVTSIRRAVVVQGFEATRNLALQLVVFDQFINKNGKQDFDLLFFWQHCLIVASLSRLIGKQLDHPDPEQLYIAGLLHDLGKMVLESCGQISYSEFLAASHTLSGDILDAEKAFFGISHDALGAWCGKYWNLPQLVVAAQAQHHCQVAHTGQDETLSRDIAIIAFADFIAWMQGLGSAHNPIASIMNHGIFTHLDTRSIDLPELLKNADDEITRVAEFYKLDFPSPVQLRSNLLDSIIANGDRQLRQKEAAQAYHPLSLTMPHQSLNPTYFIPQTLTALHDELDIERILMWRILPQNRGFTLIASNMGCNTTTLPKGIPAKLFSSPLLGALRHHHPALLDVSQNQALLNHLHCSQALVAPVLNHGRLFGLLWLDNAASKIKINPELTKEISQITHELDIALTNSATFAKEKRKAELDGLTGLFNRSALKRLLKHAYRQFESAGTVLTAGLVDIDKFKDFNDSFGHQAGDDVLKVVAQALHGLIRPGDILGRFGGDEFLFLLIGTGTEGAMNYAERAHSEVERRGKILAKRFKGRAITVSIGIASTGPGISSLTELISAADKALYLMKNSSRNGVAARPMENDHPTTHSKLSL